MLRENERKIKEKNEISNVLFSGRGFTEVKTCFLEGMRLVRALGESRDLVFFTKSVKFGFGELSICRICAESQDLQSGHGFKPVPLKIKGNSWIFILLGFKQNKKMKTNDEIGQMLVSGALDRTKKRRKTAADMFAKSGLDKP